MPTDAVFTCLEAAATMKSRSIDEAVAFLTRHDPRFSLGKTLVNGVSLPVFTAAPPSVTALLQAKAEEFGDRELLVFAKERLTYREFADRVWRFARVLQDQFAIGSGDRVAIAMRNYPEYVITLLATASLGAVAVHMNAWWTARELTYGFEDSGARLAVVDDERAERLVDIASRLKITLIRVRSSDQQAVDFDRLMERQPLATPINPGVSPDDDFSIMYTSGSTGHPKGVILTHRSVMTALWSWLMILPTYEAMGHPIPPATDQAGKPLVQSNLVTVPFFHISGTNSCFLLTLASGGKVVLMPKWDARLAVGLIEEEKITRFWGVPTMSADIVDVAAATGASLATLNSIDAGGAKRPASQVGELARQFKQASPATGFGMTETNGLGIRLSGKEYIDHPSAAGRLIPPVQALRIVADDGTVSATGVVGELLLKSAATMRGYLNKPEQTQAVLRNGWLRTGDLAYQDAQGLVYIVGRKKDMIIRGGENIACPEVEGALHQISGVLEACVFSIPHERLGETVGAAIYAASPPTQRSLQALLETSLARFKIPEQVWYYRAPLPRGATEKIDKRSIREACLNGEVEPCPSAEHG